MDSRLSLGSQTSASSNHLDSVEEKRPEMADSGHAKQTLTDRDPAGTKANTENEIYIGTIYDQHLIAYTARLVSSKFLLSGHNHELLSDDLVRVSIKSLSLLVIGSCVRFCPEVLRFKLTNDQANKVDASLFRVIDDNDIDPEQAAEADQVDLRATSVASDQNALLDIKDDHFGECSSNYKDFLSPLSKSADTIMLMQPGASDANEKNDVTKKLNINLTNYLSKSEIVEMKNYELNVNVDAVSRNVSNQCIQDVLLYYNNNDPVLRGNVQAIVGNVLVSVLSNFKSYSEFCELYQPMEDERNFLQLNLLLAIAVKVSFFFLVYLLPI